MPAPSQAQICNAALAHLGEGQRVTDINADGTPLAKVFLQTWDQAVDEVLADHPWNFAVKRKNCAISAGVTPDGSQYSQAFEKPADMLRWLPWSEDHEDYFEGEEEGDYLLSNAEAPIAVRYIARITHVAKWSAGFRAALAAKLAAMNAYAVTGQRAVASDMQTLYDDVVLPKAKRQDGAASGDRRRHLVSRSDWLNARSRSWNGAPRG
jgi:hypothetical protein